MHFVSFINLKYLDFIFLLFAVLGAEWKHSELCQQKHKGSDKHRDGSIHVVGDVLHDCSEAIGLWRSSTHISCKVEQGYRAGRSTLVLFFKVFEEFISALGEELVRQLHGLLHLWILLILREVLVVFEHWFQVLVVAFHITSNAWLSEFEGHHRCVKWTLGCNLKLLLLSGLVPGCDSPVFSQGFLRDAGPGGLSIQWAIAEWRAHVSINQFGILGFDHGLHGLSTIQG